MWSGTRYCDHPTLPDLQSLLHTFPVIIWVEPANNLMYMYIATHLKFAQTITQVHVHSGTMYIISIHLCLDVVYMHSVVTKCTCITVNALTHSLSAWLVKNGGDDLSYVWCNVAVKALRMPL